MSVKVFWAIAPMETFYLYSHSPSGEIGFNIFKYKENRTIGCMTATRYICLIRLVPTY